MDSIFSAIAGIIERQGDLAHAVLMLAVIALLYIIKLMREDLHECAQNYLQDNRMGTAALTEFTVILNQLKDKLS